VQFVIKTLVSALLVASISTASKRLPMLGAIIASLPLTSILAMVWLYTDTKDVNKVIALSQGISWIILPSLIFFIALQFLLRRNLGFFSSLFIACGVMAATYALYVNLLGRLGIKI